MSQISALISGTNRNYDYQLTALERSILNPGVISGLGVTAGAVAIGEAYILCTRTNGQQLMLHYTNTASVAITTTGTTKVWIGVSQAVINDGSSNAIDGTGIATIQTGASYPATGAYIPLASVASGVITDARVFISGKPILQKGLTANTVKENDSTGVEVLRAVASGSPLSADLIQFIDPSTRARKEGTFSVLQGLLAPQNIMFSGGVIGESITQNDVVGFYYIPPTSDTGLAYMNVGDVAANSIQTIYAFSSDTSSNTLAIRTEKVSMTANMQVRIVTTSGGVATTTQVDTNAIQTVAPASVSAGNTIMTITFPGSFNCGPVGTLIAIQFCQGTFASPTVGANYYQVRYALGNSTMRPTDVTNTPNNGAFQTTTTSPVLNISATTVRPIKIISVTGDASIPSGQTISITAGSRVYSWVTSGAGATQTLPSIFEIPTGQAFSINCAYAPSRGVYDIGTAIVTDDVSGLTRASFSGLTQSFVSRAIGEMIVTSPLLSTTLLKKAYSTGLSITHKGLAPGSLTIPATGIVSNGYFSMSSLTLGSTYRLSPTPGLISLTSGNYNTNIDVGIADTANVLRTLTKI